MKDSWVTVAAFYSVGEAELVRNRLEEEGIPAHLSDTESVTMVPLWAAAIGGVKLLVAEEDAGRAEAILRRVKQRGGSGRRRDDYGLEENITANPEKVRVPTDEEPLDEDEDEDEEEAVLDSPKDVIARRAWLAAVFGLLCPGVLHIVSILMLLDIREAPGKLTPMGRRWALAALLLDALILIGGIGLIVAAYFRT